MFCVYERLRRACSRATCALIALARSHILKSRTSARKLDCLLALAPIGDVGSWRQVGKIGSARKDSRVENWFTNVKTLCRTGTARADEGDATLTSIGRNRRPAPAPAFAFTSNVSASLGVHCDRARSRMVLATRLSRWVLGFTAIAALAACGGDGMSLTSVSDAGAATATKPTINLQLTPGSVSMGQSATLTWSVSGAQSCTASGGWSGTKPTSGKLSTTPLASSTSYTLTCAGSGGSAVLSKQVVVTQPAPIVTLVASPTTISSLGSSTLTWTSSNADQCKATGGWRGAVTTSGTWSTGALSNTTEYELTCKGPGGSATQSATVTVSALPPAVTMQASPSSVSSGGSSTLTWSSQNATSCTASGAWSGTKAVSGSQSTGPVNANAVYTLTCSGFGGSASQSATVSVTSPAPAV